MMIMIFLLLPPRPQLSHIHYIYMPLPSPKKTPKHSPNFNIPKPHKQDIAYFVSSLLPLPLLFLFFPLFPISPFPIPPPPPNSFFPPYLPYGVGRSSHFRFSSYLLTLPYLPYSANQLTQRFRLSFKRKGGRWQGQVRDSGFFLRC